MTHICPYIRYYERGTWNYLSRVFGYNLKASELGFTNDLVFRITDFYNTLPNPCEVYIINEGVNEAVRGADMDLLIEDGNTGGYDHFMLQAKMMDFNGRYYDIKRWSRNAQFYKIIRNATLEGAVPLYLFYNGLTPNSNLGDIHWGLSIINANEIRKIRLAQRHLLRAPLITFNQLHTLNLRKFNVLFCTIPEDFKKKSKPKKKDQIYTGYPYTKIDLYSKNFRRNKKREREISKEESQEISNIVKEKRLAPVRIIINSKPNKN